MLEKAAAFGSRAEGHYRYRMRPVVREFAVSMREGGSTFGNTDAEAQMQTKLYEQRFMNYFFEKLCQANVVARHKSEIGIRIWDADRGNFLKAIQMARDIPIRVSCAAVDFVYNPSAFTILRSLLSASTSFAFCGMSHTGCVSAHQIYLKEPVCAAQELELAFNARSILKLCYPAHARIALYSRCVRMAEPVGNRNDTCLVPMLVELAQAYHDHDDDVNAREYYRRAKSGVPVASSVSAVGEDRASAVAPPIYAADHASLRASTGRLDAHTHDDKSERESIFQSHSQVEDEEALLHLEALLLTNSKDDDADDGCGTKFQDDNGRPSAALERGSSCARTAIAISTLKERLRRPTLQKASSFEPAALESLLDSRDNTATLVDTQQGKDGNGVARRRARLTSASATFVTSRNNDGRCPGMGAGDQDTSAIHDTNHVELDELARSRPRPARSSSDGQMEDITRQRLASRISSEKERSLPAVAASPQSASASSSATASNGDRGLEAASVSEVKLSVNGDGGDPPPIDITHAAREPSMPKTPPPPSSPSRLHQSEHEQQQDIGADSSRSPPAGSMVDSPPILRNATKSTLFYDGTTSGHGASDKREGDDSSSIVVKTSEVGVSGIQALPQAYTDGGASMELLGRKRALRRQLMPELEPEPELELMGELEPEPEVELLPPSAESARGRLPIQFKTIESLLMESHIPYAGEFFDSID